MYSPQDLVDRGTLEDAVMDIVLFGRLPSGGSPSVGPNGPIPGCSNVEYLFSSRGYEFQLSTIKQLEARVEVRDGCKLVHTTTRRPYKEITVTYEGNTVYSSLMPGPVPMPVLIDIAAVHNEALEEVFGPTIYDPLPNGGINSWLE
jgi:hypothetical protein